VHLHIAAETAIVEHARLESPSECCGLLIGDADGIAEAIPARNIATDVAREYLIDPRDHLRAIRAARARGLDVVGAYHSHPRSAAAPSPTDAAAAFSDFVYLIVGLRREPPELAAWTWADGNFTAVPLVRVPKGAGG
jgi:proteasome lid subunit RPN8/RPN11